VLKLKNLVKREKKLEEKCNYPKCNGNVKKWLDLPILQRHEGDRLVKTEQYKRCYFCDYHFYVAASGLFGAIPKSGRDGGFSLIGPFEEVLVSECVMAAREMTKTKSLKVKK